MTTSDACSSMCAAPSQPARGRLLVRSLTSRRRSADNNGMQRPAGTTWSSRRFARLLGRACPPPAAADAEVRQRLLLPGGEARVRRRDRRSPGSETHAGGVMSEQDMTRRRFVRRAAAGAFGLALAGPRLARPDGAKRLEGVFPIMQTPFTGADRLDTETLAREVEFLDRCGVHGVVWPQLASEYFDLT